MKENLMFIGLGVVVFGALIIGVLWVVYLVLKIATDNLEDENEWLLKLHCFECEFEMPVKEKNGRLYCSNCGLYHDAFK